MCPLYNCPCERVATIEEIVQKNKSINLNLWFSFVAGATFRATFAER